MDLMELQNTLASVLLGNELLETRILGNTLGLYFIGDPYEGKGVALLIDPPWRCEINKKIILGSYDLDISQYEKSGISEDAYMTMMSSHLGAVSGSTLTDLNINPYTLDMRLLFSGEGSIISFNNSCGVDDCWKVVDGLNKKKYIASTGGVMVRLFDFNKYRRTLRGEYE